jgi:hypothetical protein
MADQDRPSRMDITLLVVAILVTLAFTFWSGYLVGRDAGRAECPVQIQ